MSELFDREECQEDIDPLEDMTVIEIEELGMNMMIDSIDLLHLLETCHLHLQLLFLT